MSEPLLRPGRSDSPPVFRSYRIAIALPDAGDGFHIIQTGTDGQELQLLACASLEEAQLVQAALEQLDAAEALARGHTPPQGPRLRP